MNEFWVKQMRIREVGTNINADQPMFQVCINKEIFGYANYCFSTTSQLSYTKHEENSNTQKLEASVSTSTTILLK